MQRAARNQRQPDHDEQRVLVLQGGGALGAYQAGVYEELAAAELFPDWVAGISVGAINASIIAGNPVEHRVERLRAFWERVSSSLRGEPPFSGEWARMLFNEASASLALVFGLPGFFSPRMPPAMLYPPGAKEALSVYDTAMLRQTLAELVDFDRINDGDMRLSVGAVNIRSGNFVYFDSATREIGAEHVMASGALPPGFPPIEIHGESYWDGGLVSNTPLQYVLDDRGQEDRLVFQVDLFSARGSIPRTLSEVAERAKEIRYSSRTRLNTDTFRHMQTLRRAACRLCEKLPPELRDDPDARLLSEIGNDAAVTIVHLIHRSKNYQTQSMDFEFSRHSIEEHWQAGRDDVRRTLRHDEWRHRAKPGHGVAVFDLTRDARD